MRAVEKGILAEHLRQLSIHFSAISRTWDGQEHDEMDFYIGEGYPFKTSFDELDSDVAEWVTGSIFNLEKKDRPIAIDVSDDYEATITKDNVKVGCQNFHIDNIRDLIQLHDKHFKEEEKCNHVNGTYLDGMVSICVTCGEILNKK